MPLITKTDINDDGLTGYSWQVEDNIDKIFWLLNGKLDEENIDPNSNIAVTTWDRTITGVWTFATNPVFNDNAIPDSALSTNVALKDQANVFTALQTFQAGADFSKQEAKNFKVEKLTSLPTPTAEDEGRIIEYNNKIYGCAGGAWKDLTYVGDYTGGALRTYAFTFWVDDDNPFKVVIKKDSGNTTATLFIQGDVFPSTFYRELGSHSHPIDSTANAVLSLTVDDPGHYHPVNIGSHTHPGSFATKTHTHNINDYTGDNVQSLDHNHPWSGDISPNPHHHTVSDGDGALYTGDTTLSIDGTVGGSGDIPHSHPINVTTSGPSAYASVGSYDYGTKDSDSATTGITVSGAISGSTELAGVDAGGISTTRKTYVDSIQVYIAGQDITNNILTATGWTSIGDGTSSHAFITTGVEIEIFRKVTGEVIGTGDGTTTTFSATLTYTPVKANTVKVKYTIGATIYEATDDGAGNISGTDCSGTIDYDTGAIDLTFTTAPDDGTDITADYEKGWLNDGYNKIEIIEPVTGKGGLILMHVEVV